MKFFFSFNFFYNF